MISYILIMHEVKITKQDKNLYHDFLFYAILSGIICARIYYIIFSWDYYKNNLLEIFALRKGGLGIYGAIIGGWLSAIIFCKIKKCNLNLFLDTCSLGLLTGQIIGRWGNFFNREAFGRDTKSFFAMRYLYSKVNCDIKKTTPIIIDGIKYIQVHPTFLYESSFNFILLIFLMCYKSKKKFDGEIFWLYIFFYSCARFWIESLRVDQLILFNMPVSQILSVILFLIAIYVMIKKYREYIKFNFSK